MKFLFILTYYRPHWTGLTQYAARLAERLARDHQVEVLCSRHQKTLSREEEINKVKVFRLPYLFRFLRSVIAPSFPWELVCRLRKNDLAIAYLPLQEAWLVALAARALGKKLFLVHNGDLVLPRSGGLLNRLVERLYYLSTGFAIQLSEGIIIQTKDYAQRSKLLSRYQEKWRVILPLYEDIFSKPAKTEEFIKKFHLVGKSIIGFSGRFVEEKGVDFLLKAIPAVIKEIPQAHFVFAGDYRVKYERFWEMVRPLVERYKKNLTLLGLIKDPAEIVAFYQSLDVLVQPSRTDCFPSSQVEALLSGVPCVCTDIPGARWAVGQTGAGVVVKSGSAQALADGIVEVIKNKKQYQSKTKRARKLFDNRKTFAEYVKLFEKS